MTDAIDRIKQAIRDVPDFPKPGILFKDITPVLADPALFRSAVDVFAQRHQDRAIDKIAAIDARGFFFGSVLAERLNAGLVPIRKKGKLPYKAIEASYDLEYGSATLTMHEDAIQPGEKVLLIDDLLATGGTAGAAASLIGQLQGDIVEIDFLIELTFLKGREKIQDYPVYAAITF